MPMSTPRIAPATARDAVSIRLATEFHILLANMTNSPILVRYVSEVAYRCCLTLSLYSRPHSSECAINEHRAIIAALVKGDERQGDEPDAQPSRFRRQSRAGHALPRSAAAICWIFWRPMRMKARASAS